MGRLGGSLAASALIALAIAAPASAAPTASVQTTTGQTLTITIDSPADGAALADNVAIFSGHAGLSPASDGGAGTTVARVDWSVDPAWGTGQGDPPAADGTWSRSLRANGPRDVRFIAVAADGTTATADVQVTFPPYTTFTYATPLMKTGTPPFMHGLVFNEYDIHGPTNSGSTVDLYVLGQKVCSATASNGAFSCADPAANLLAVAAGGYDAVLVGTPYYATSSDHAGLNTD